MYMADCIQPVCNILKQASLICYLEVVDFLLYAGGWMTGVQFLIGEGIFLFTVTYRLALGSNQPHIQ
jgi:hypothetical protein